MERHRTAIAGRHVAKKAPANWYRTIDRITPALAARAKLLIPDIKGSAHVVYESGQLYPHHNLYYVESNEWDLRPFVGWLMVIEDAPNSSAAVIVTPRSALADGAYSELSAMTGLRSFVAALAGHIAIEAAR